MSYFHGKGISFGGYLSDLLMLLVDADCLALTGSLVHDDLPKEYSVFTPGLCQDFTLEITCINFELG